MPADPSVPTKDTAAEVVADHLAVTLGMCGDGTDAHSSELGSLSIDALLAHAAPSEAGVRRVVLEGRSGQDARIRGLEQVIWGGGRLAPFDPPLYRLTDPSPEEA